MSLTLTFHSNAKMTLWALCCHVAADAFGKSLSVVYCNPLIIMSHFIFYSFMIKPWISQNSFWISLLIKNFKSDNSKTKSVFWCLPFTRLIKQFTGKNQANNLAGHRAEINAPQQETTLSQKMWQTKTNKPWSLEPRSVCLLISAAEIRT